MGIVQGIRSGILSGILSGINPVIGGAPVIIMPSLRAVGAGASGIGNVPVPAPGGLTAIDVELMVAELIQTETIADPSGWTALSASPQVAAATKLQAWWRRWNGVDGDPTLIDPGNHIVAYRAAFQDVIVSGDPFDFVAGAILASTTSMSCPGGTTLAANRYIVAMCAAGTDTSTPQFSGEANASLSGLAELKDFFATDGGGGGVGMWGGGRAAQGTVDPTTATLAAASSLAMITCALKGRVA